MTRQAKKALAESVENERLSRELLLLNSVNAPATNAAVIKVACEEQDLIDPINVPNIIKSTSVKGGAYLLKNYISSGPT